MIEPEACKPQPGAAEGIESPQAAQAALEKLSGVPGDGFPDAKLLPPVRTLRCLRAEAEILAISRALEQTGWNRKRAAELLNISYRGLLYKIRQHNITGSSRL